MRRPHYIRENKNTETPQNAIWFDTETDPVSLDESTIGHRLRFGQAVYRRTRSAGRWTRPEWLTFHDKATFWDWVDSHTADKKTLYLFCHNTSFDLPVMDIFNELEKRGWKLKSAIIDAPPTILTFSKGKRKIRVLDTLNLWRVPLSKVGDMIGLPKLDMPASDASPEEWETYARRDTEIIMEACVQWWDWLIENDMGGFAPTLASQALRTWRHRFMDRHVLVHDTDSVLTMEREAYHGGRVECFRIGEYHGSFHLFDVNSLYPSVMQRGLFPVQLRFTSKDIRRFDFDFYFHNFATIARCRIRTDQPIYGLIRDGKLIFPVGEFAITLTGPEIQTAMDRGHLLGIDHIAFYDAAPIFESFVTEIYARRLEAKREGNETRSYNWKILLNSLYGKFGQRGEVWESVGNIQDLSAEVWTELDADTGRVRTFRKLGGLLQELSREQESRESCPAIAAYVTAMARLRLWELIELAGLRNVYYVDTDSLLVNDAGARRLKKEIDPDALGKLKLEASMNHVILRGAKDYTFGDRTKIKGVRKTAVWLDKDTIQQERWRGLRGQIQDGIVNMPTTATVTKRLKRVYDKGRVLPSGRVAPLKLG